MTAVEMRRGASVTGTGDDLPGLYLAVEKWERQGATGKGIVLVITHANGFQKEVGLYSSSDRADLVIELMDRVGIRH